MITSRLKELKTWNKPNNILTSSDKHGSVSQNLLSKKRAISIYGIPYGDHSYIV